MQATLTEKAYVHIRERLMQGDMQPGARLVTRTLAGEIGVSLAPVREAIHRLASEGLVEHIPGAGAFALQPDRRDLEELYILRDATESCAAAEAAKYISAEELDDLDAIVVHWAEVADEIADKDKPHATRAQLSRWLDNEERFHAILVDASRNLLLAKVIREYRAIRLVFEAQREDPAILTRAVVERTVRDRRELMQALRERDAERARRLMSRQIQIGRKTVLEFLRRGIGEHPSLSSLSLIVILFVSVIGFLCSFFDKASAFVQALRRDKHE